MSVYAIAFDVPKELKKAINLLRSGVSHAEWLLDEDLFFCIKTFENISSEDRLDILNSLNLFRFEPVFLQFEGIQATFNKHGSGMIYSLLHPELRTNYLEFQKKINQHLKDAQLSFPKDKKEPILPIGIFKNTSPGFLSDYLELNYNFNTPRAISNRLYFLNTKNLHTLHWTIEAKYKSI